MSLKEFTALATSLRGDNKLATEKQMAEFVMLAKECADNQQSAEDQQTVAEYASGATACAEKLHRDNFDLDAVHTALLGLEVEYDAKVIKSEWMRISGWLESYLL